MVHFALEKGTFGRFFWKAVMERIIGAATAQL